MLCRRPGLHDLLYNSMQSPVVGSQLRNSSICLRCMLRLFRSPESPSRRLFSTSLARRSATATSNLSSRDYFSAHKPSLATTSQPRNTSPITTLPSFDTLKLAPEAEHLSPSWGVSVNDGAESQANPQLPHRQRRKRLKDASSLPNPIIPPDASSRLSALSQSLPPTSVRRLLSSYLSLSKPRLTFLIVLTTAAAYSLYPVPALLLPSATDSPSLSTLALVSLTSGTALCSASANALNMLMEPAHDAKMSRTRNRVLVRGLIKMRGALIFAIVSGLGGIGSLWYGVNPTVAFIGGLNIWLYAGV